MPRMMLWDDPRAGRGRTGPSDRQNGQSAGPNEATAGFGRFDGRSGLFGLAGRGNRPTAILPHSAILNFRRPFYPFEQS